MIPADLVAFARDCHRGPERGYHGWSHPQALLHLLDEVRGDLHDPVAVEAAVLFHDAVYDARAADNEERSALLTADRLEGRLPPETVRRATALIRATARHAVPDGLPPAEVEDMAIFLDMDLSVLGAEPAAFDAYEAGVRHEYAHVPDAAFAAGRSAILRRFAGRAHLFLSAWGRARFEAGARANLARSIGALERG